MKVLFEKHEAEEMFHDALCNGLSEISIHGLKIDYSDDDYKKAKDKLSTDEFSAVYYDVLMQILKDGNKLKLVDEEGDNSWSITLGDVHGRMSNVDFKHLVDMSYGNDDAVTADVIIQTIFINDVMYG